MSLLLIQTFYDANEMEKSSRRYLNCRRVISMTQIYVVARISQINCVIVEVCMKNARQFATFSHGRAVTREKHNDNRKSKKVKGDRERQ